MFFYMTSLLPSILFSSVPRSKCATKPRVFKHSFTFNYDYLDGVVVAYATAALKISGSILRSDQIFV